MGAEWGLKMIKLKRHEKEDQIVTPKRLAQEMVSNALDTAEYWEEKDHIHNVEEMTELEKQKVNEQINKLVIRLNKILGYVYND